MDHATQCTNDYYAGVIRRFKSIYGLGDRAFGAPLMQVLGIKSLFAVACRQVLTLWQALADDLRGRIVAVAEEYPRSNCAVMRRVADCWSISDLPVKHYIHEVESKFWKEHSRESRHHQF